MPVSINGQTGVITGLAVGGLPDGIVDTDMLAAGAVTAAKRGAGAILQVVQTMKTDVFTTFQNAGVEVEITGLNATITPTSNTSKILVSFHIQVGQYGTTYGVYPKRVISGGSTTIIFIGDASSNRQRVTAPTGIAEDNNQMDSLSFAGLDSPATTSAVTYKMFAISDGGDLRINRSRNDTDAAVGKRTVSSITLMEVAA